MDEIFVFAASQKMSGEKERAVCSVNGLLRDVSSSLKGGIIILYEYEAKEYLFMG